MKTVGMYLLIAGIGTIALNQFGMEFSLLGWIDNWGETVGWMIRGGAIVVGAALFFLGKNAETSAEIEG
ncbi:MAG: hypothetical protein AAF270_01105 [Pseudomonadota bacterium]